MTLVKCPKCKCDIENDSYFCDQCGTELYICPQCKTFGKGKRCTNCGTELVRASEYTGAAPAPQPAPAPAAPQQPQQPAPEPAPQSVTPQPAPQPTTQPMPAPAPQPQMPAPEHTTIPQAPQPQMPQPVAPQPQMPQPAAPAADKTIRPGAPQPAAAPQLQPGHIVCYYPQHIRLGLASGVIIGRRGHYPTVFGQFGDVSGNHARLDQYGTEWKVTDLGSTNGTFLNGAPLQPNMAYTIHVGDTLRFSTLDFKVEV